MKVSKVTVNIPDEQIEFLQETAKKEDLTVTDILRLCENKVHINIDVWEDITKPIPLWLTEKLVIHLMQRNHIVVISLKKIKANEQFWKDFVANVFLNKTFLVFDKNGKLLTKGMYDALLTSYLLSGINDQPLFLL